MLSFEASIQMEKIRKNAFGIDIGSKNIFVSVDSEPVISFETFTESFYEARDYLLSRGITPVASIATGVYRVILYDVLERAGLDVWLVDGHQTRQVPGRKTDVKDCQWIQQLHSYGLLNRCFVPEDAVKEVRACQRMREDHIRSNKPNVDHSGGHLLKIFSGTDATQLPGITDYTWLQLYAEIGKDLSNWPTEKHFTSWLGLAPGQHQSGKKSKTRKKKYRPKAGQIFRTIAQSLIESKKIAIGAFGRRLKARREPGIAVKATARKPAVLYRRLIIHGVAYTEQGIKAYEEQMKMDKERWLVKNAKELGYQFIYQNAS